MPASVVTGLLPERDENGFHTALQNTEYWTIIHTDSC